MDFERRLRLKLHKRRSLFQKSVNQRHGCMLKGVRKIKTTIKYHLTLVIMAIIKKSTNNKFWRLGEGKETLLQCRWEGKLV